LSNDRSSEVLGALPRTRPHRRSAKRPARSAAESEPQRTPDAAGAEAKQAKATAGTQAKATGATRAKQQPTRTPAKSTRAKPATVGSGARPSRVESPGARRLAQPAQPRGVPAAARPARQAAPTRAPVLSTAVQAAAELAEIGLTLSARALRRAVGRLPRP
jgi:hypothetical protein